MESSLIGNERLTRRFLEEINMDSGATSCNNVPLDCYVDSTSTGIMDEVASTLRPIRDALVSQGSKPDDNLDITDERRVERALQRTPSLDLPTRLRPLAKKILAIALLSVRSIDWMTVALEGGLPYEKQVSAPVEVLAFLLNTKSGRQCLVSRDESDRVALVTIIFHAVFQLSILPFRHSMSTLLLPALGIVLTEHRLGDTNLRMALVDALRPYQPSWVAKTLADRLDNYISSPKQASLPTVVQVMRLVGAASSIHEEHLVVCQTVIKCYRAFHTLCAGGDDMATVAHGTLILEWILHLSRASPDLLQPIIEEGDFVAGIHFYLVLCAWQTIVPHAKIAFVSRGFLERIRFQIVSDSVEANALVERAEHLVADWNEAFEPSEIATVWRDFIGNVKEDCLGPSHPVALRFLGFSFDY